MKWAVFTTVGGENVAVVICRHMEDAVHALKLLTGKQAPGVYWVEEVRS